MMNVFDLVQGPVLAVERVPRSEISSYGVVDAEPLGKDVMGGRIYRVKDLVEKPPVEEAPSDLAIIGRYILTPDIFETLETTERDKGGEIQLTNGLRALLKRRPIFAYEIDGVRHDTGNKLGFLKAMVYFALKRPDLAEGFKSYLSKMGTPVGK
jgi:UTP--glucose-1-phosphate uridylyltransferase